MRIKEKCCICNKPFCNGESTYIVLLKENKFYHIDCIVNLQSQLDTAKNTIEKIKNYIRWKTKQYCKVGKSECYCISDISFLMSEFYE